MFLVCQSSNLSSSLPFAPNSFPSSTRTGQKIAHLLANAGLSTVDALEAADVEHIEAVVNRRAPFGSTVSISFPASAVLLSFSFA